MVILSVSVSLQEYPERHKEYYLKNKNKAVFSEMYLRIRLLVDYISGMTDTFAESEYKVLNGIH